MLQGTHAEPPAPRGGRRFLPGVAAFGGAVALHAALAAGFMGMSSHPPELSSGPEGFRMVSLPERTPDQPAPPSPEPPAQESEPKPQPPKPEPAPEPDKPPPAKEPQPPETESKSGLTQDEETEPEPRPKPEPEPEPDPEPQPQKESESRPEPPKPEKRPSQPERERARPDPGADSYRPPRSDTAYLRNPPPRYPLLARRRGLEGRVVLKVRVSAKGDPLSVKVAESSGHSVLDRRARQAVREWEFEPARRGGRPVAGTVKVPVRFTLSRR